jgi:hypothetical protein
MGPKRKKPWEVYCFAVALMSRMMNVFLPLTDVINKCTIWLQKHLFSTYQRPRVARDADVLIGPMTSRFAPLESPTLDRNGRSG